MSSGPKMSIVDTICFLDSPYSPDFAPSNFHLFRSLSNVLSSVSINNGVELRACLDEFCKSKEGHNYKQDVKKLNERWREIVNNNGKSIIE